MPLGQPAPGTEARVAPQGARGALDVFLPPGLSGSQGAGSVGAPSARSRFTPLPGACRRRGVNL